MDARPYALNKILPCTKRVKLIYRYSNGVSTNIAGVYGYGLDDSVNEYITAVGEIPKGFKTGSDLKIMFKCCGLVDNPIGADKVIRIKTNYNFARNGLVVGSVLGGDVLLVTIADGQEKYTIQEVTSITASGLQADDTIGVEIIRDAAHGDDNYVGDFMICRPVVGEYIADKIGVT